MEGFFTRAFTPEWVMDLLTTGQIFAPFIERTKAESKADGVMEGEAKGEEKKRRQIAMNLLADGISPEYVAKVTGMEANERHAGERDEKIGGRCVRTVACLPSPESFSWGHSLSNLPKDFSIRLSPIGSKRK